MSRGNLQQALENTNTVYQELVAIANDIIDKCVKESRKTMAEIRDNIATMTNDDIRVYMTKLSLLAYSLSEIKDKAAMKSSVAATLRKEAYANEFNGASGAVAARESVAQLNTADEILSQTVNDLVADVLKSHLDEIHRMIQVLQSCIMSRLSEAKFMSITDTTTND